MFKNQIDTELLNWYLGKDSINEATDTAGASGSYRVPIRPGTRMWEKDSLEPFTIKVSKYNDSDLAYDSYDGKLDVSKKKASKMEKKSKSLAIKDKKRKENQDDDGLGAGRGDGDGDVSESLSNIIKKVINEDLGVWFGTKKKPKGSKQPKGPWVNICRKKKGGGHPPCGRPDASDKAYPKCRAAGVAAHMTDSQKRSACQQKRKAEKTHSKSGTGNKPKMVHYKPKNESLKELIKGILRENFS